MQRFINRHKEIKSKYSRRYDYQRALCEDPRIIRDWFQLVQNTIAKYGIVEQDIYNFDETGFSMGMTSTAKVYSPVINILIIESILIMIRSLHLRFKAVQKPYNQEIVNG